MTGIFSSFIIIITIIILGDCYQESGLWLIVWYPSEHNVRIYFSNRKKSTSFYTCNNSFESLNMFEVFFNTFFFLNPGMFSFIYF